MTNEYLLEEFCLPILFTTKEKWKANELFEKTRRQMFIPYQRSVQLLYSFRNKY